ncbi:MAG: PAS domain S-box protein [Candidatus Acidiferrales bacterium]
MGTVVITALYDDSGELRGFSKVTRDTSHRRKLEQELHTLAAVVQNCRDFIGVCSPDMKTAYLNEAGLSMVGLDSLEAARNTPVIDYFWPEDRPMILERAVPILMRDGNWRGEVRFRNFKTGEPIHTVWDAFAVRDETGQTTGYATISPNLERMKQLQTALSEADKILRDTEARHAGIVSSAMDAIITVNDKQKIQVFNLAAEKMFLCPAAQALGQPLSTFIPERFRGAHSGHIHKFGENGSTSRAMGALTSLWGLRSNGEEFPIEASISKMNTNGDKLFTAIVRDITERLKSAEALRRSDVTRMMALDSARLGDWQLDLQTGAATRSLLHDEIFGYTDKQPEWNFDIFMSHVHPDDRERIAHTFKECLDEQRKWDFECRILWPDQSIHWIWACGSHYKDETGKSTHVMGTVADITERKRADELRLRSQKLEGLGTLSGGIAHDFNNILLAITGNAKLAIADLPPDHPVQQSLAEIAKAGSRATDLVRRILTFSRPGEVKRQVCLLQPIVEEALKLVRATIPATVEFRTAFAPNLPAVLADSTQIHQIIVNLATNAAHAIGSKSDGRIEIQLDSATLTADDISPALNLSEGPYVRLRVSDNGCGMDRATLNRIFDPFFTTKGPGEGTGLGLSVVHGIMKNHDGGISVYSEPGSGTAFRLFFPAAAAALIAAAPAAAAPIERVCTERVLYVDDEQALVMLVTRTLGRLGYKVTGQTDPLAAVALFRSDPSAFDVVVTDLAMPQLSGFDLSSQLLAIRPDLPIVMTSGYVRPEDQQRAVQLGVRDLILKPDTIDQLGRTLDRVLQHHLTDPQPIAR